MDINCDLGEGEDRSVTRSFMPWITSANIACGGHAGDAISMKTCLELCAEFGVHPGAHPSFEDRENFGRIPHLLSHEDLKLLLENQVSRLGKAPRHIKLHGALYHLVDSDSLLARAFVQIVKIHHPTLRILALAGGNILAEARSHNIEAWGEIFAERGYLPSGHLVPRTQPGALIDNLEEIRERAILFKEEGLIRAIDGSLISLDAQTICIHSDSPGALEIAQVLAETFSN